MKKLDCRAKTGEAYMRRKGRSQFYMHGFAISIDTDFALVTMAALSGGQKLAVQVVVEAH